MNETVALLHQPYSVGKNNNTNPIAALGFSQNIGDMGFDGCRPQKELASNLSVG